MKRLLALGFALALAAPATALPEPPDMPPQPATSVPADDAQCDTCDALQLIEEGEYGRAHHILEMRAAKGDPYACTVLGKMHQSGWGVAVDYDRAMGFYQTAAREGDSLALNQIGYMLLHGLGRPADPKAAWCWFEQAAERGVALSTHHLAELMAAGMQPISCQPSGARLSDAAARPRDPKAVVGTALEFWNGVREGMTPDQVAALVPAPFRGEFPPGAQFSEHPNSDVVVAPAVLLGHPAVANVTFVDHAARAVVLNVDPQSDDQDQCRKLALALKSRFTAAYGPPLKLFERDGALVAGWRRGDLSIELSYFPLPDHPPGFSVSFARYAPDLVAPPAMIADGQAGRGG